MLVYKGLAFRSMHSHGRALNGLLPRAVDDVDAYDVREGELVAGVVLGYNFGDGHFHNQRLLEAVQERCRFEPGELRVVTLESQPAQRPRASATGSTTRPTGLIEEGTVEVAEMVAPPALARRASVPGRGRRGEAQVDGTGMSAAVVVGSGPERARLRRDPGARGVEVTVIEAAETIGGGTRTSELTLPGAAARRVLGGHPMAVGSPALDRARARAPRARVGLARDRPRPPARRRRRRR